MYQYARRVATRIRVRMERWKGRLGRSNIITRWVASALVALSCCVACFVRAMCCVVCDMCRIYIVFWFCAVSRQATENIRRNIKGDSDLKEGLAKGQ